MNGQAAGDGPGSTEAVDLTDKPVLEWTAQDWARWAVSPTGAPTNLARPHPPVTSEPSEPSEPSGPSGPSEPSSVLEAGDDSVGHAAVDEVPAAGVAGAGVAGAGLTEAGVAGAGGSWWASRPAQPDPVAPEPEPAPVDDAASRAGRPAHRRHAAPSGRLDRRLRAAAGLIGVSVLVGAVLASVVTVMLFVTTLVLQGLTG
ncbi:MAG: hypothetical protein ACRD1K_14665 [Acidimicrobiales bacterium]